MKTSRERIRLTLRTRFVIALVGVAVVPLFIFSSFNQIVSRNVLRERAHEALSSAARFNALKLDSFLRSALTTTEVAASLREFEQFLEDRGDDGSGDRTGATWEGVLETLHRVADKDRVFIVSVALLDRDGWNLADTRDPGIGRNESATPSFMNAMLSGLSTVQIHRGDGAAHADELCFSAPIFAHGRFFGVLRICYGLAALRHAILPGVGMAGPSSFPLVLDERGELLVAAFRGEGPDLTRLGPVLAGMGLPANFSVSDEKAERAWMGASVPVETNRWRVSYLQERDFFFASIDRQLRLSIYIFGVLIVSASLFSWVSARRLVAPLYSLKRSAERIAAGDWSVQTEGARSEEIASLERSFVGMARELERREGELIAAKSNAEAAAQAKADFLAVMTHEVRTPLNTVIGFCNLMLEDEKTEPHQIEYLRRMEGGARQLLLMVNEILDFSRIEAGRMVFRQRRFSIEELFSDVVEICGNAPWDKGLEVFFHLGPGTPNELVGDLRSLTQILANLVNNAVKFTKTGGVVVEVEPVGGPDPNELRFTVSDTGRGLPEGAGEALFEPFTQGDSTTRRRHSGTGLGLAICRRLVEALGGSIGFDPAYTGGARFQFSAPVGEWISSVFVPAAPDVRVTLLSASPFFQDEMRRLLGALGVGFDLFDPHSGDGLPDDGSVVLVHWNDALVATPVGLAMREQGGFRPVSRFVVLLQPTLHQGVLPEALGGARVLHNPVFPWELAAALRDLAVERPEPGERQLP